MNFLGRLFGTEKALNTAVESLRDGLDALVYTEEERETDAAKDRSEARRMFIEWMRNSQGQNLARRILALTIAGIWLMQYIVAQLLLVTAVWVETPAEVVRIERSARIIGDYADGMTGAMMLILGFYFAAPHLDKLVGGAMSRFEKTTGRKADE